MSAYRTRFVADNDAVYEQSKLRVLFGFFFFLPRIEESYESESDITAWIASQPTLSRTSIW